MAALSRALLPEDLPETLWSVLSWVHATDRLSASSAPLEILLEPLRCYGGLDRNGAPMVTARRVIESADVASTVSPAMTLKVRPLR